MKPIQKAIIPIAGYGTRLFPATKAVPKALFPIIAEDGIAKPVIQLIIEEALSAGTVSFTGVQARNPKDSIS